MRRWTRTCRFRSIAPVVKQFNNLISVLMRTQIRTTGCRGFDIKKEQMI